MRNYLEGLYPKLLPYEVHRASEVIWLSAASDGFPAHHRIERKPLPILWDDVLSEASHLREKVEEA